MGTVLDFYNEYHNIDWIGHDIPKEITDCYEMKACLKMTEDKQVYLVTSKINRKKYILKALASHCHESLYEEYKLSMELSHPGIIAASEYIPGNDYNYLIREYVEGYTITEMVEMTEAEHLQHDELVRITMQLCDILQYLHSQKPPIIHRDIKPDNVIITKQKECKLIDFGISRRYQDKVDSDTFVMGSQFSAAPEQYGFAQTNERSDIYAIGVLMFYMTTGCLDIRELKQYQIPGELLRIIKKCTNFSPKDRYSSVKQLKSKLISYPYLFRKRRLIYAGIGIVATFALVLVLSLLSPLRPKAEGFRDKAVGLPTTGKANIEVVSIHPTKEEVPQISISAPVASEDNKVTEDAVSDKETSKAEVVGKEYTNSELTNLEPIIEPIIEPSIKPSIKTSIEPSIETSKIPSTESSIKPGKTLQAAEPVANSTEIKKEEKRQAKDQIDTKENDTNKVSVDKQETVAVAEDDRIYEFKSPLIEAAIREILGKTATDNVTYRDLEQITSLFLCGQQRYNRWEEHFVYGVNQYMIGSQYTDKQLFTFNGEITTLEDISHMVNLEKLALYNQKISDLSPLENLHYLSYLGLGSNEISELTQLTSIKSLNYLDLSGNPIMNDDLEQLKELPYLWGLDLGATKVTSVYGIKERKLSYLSLFECKMGDCIGLDEITTLDNLILTGVNNAITDRAIDRVSKLTNLKILKIFGSDRIDLSKLSTLKSLYLLDLCGMWNNSDLGDLTNPALTQIYLVFWQKLDLTGIEKLTSIEQIHLRDSKCSDYTPLLSVKTLKTVYCNQEQQKIIKEQLGEVPFEVLIE